MKVYLLRHGETEWNVQHRVQGALDSPLTENGIQQAKNAAKRLAKVEFDAAFASPSPRAYRTAQIIAGPHKGLVIQKENSLREFSFGVYEGHSLDNMHVECPKLWGQFETTPSLVTSPEGDCMVARVAERRRFVEKLTAQYMHKQVLCVSHGFGVCYFLSAALGIPLEHSHKFASGNTALTIIEFLAPDRPLVRIFSDTSHNE